jgi:hypothetical protein
MTDVFSHPAWGIVVDANKCIYFSDLETVYKIDSQGKLSIFRAGVSGRHVHDLSVDAGGNVYGLENVYEPRTEKHLRAIWKISPAGAYTEIVSLTENLPSGMSNWLDADGNTYSVEPWNNEKKETKIIKRTADGKTSVYAGGKYGYLDGRKEKAEFGAITDLVFGLDKAIYLTDDNRVRKIDETGNVKTIYSKEITVKNQKSVEASPQLFGLDVDPQNNIFAADFANRRLLKINSDGAVTMFYTSEKDWSPLGVATFGDEVFVLEGRPLTASVHTGNRVFKVSSSGAATLIANLEDRNQPVTNPKLNSVNMFAKTEASNIIASNADSGDIKDTATNPLGFYGVVGALSIAFIALMILAKRK